MPFIHLHLKKRLPVFPHFPLRDTPTESFENQTLIFSGLEIFAVTSLFFFIPHRAQPEWQAEICGRNNILH